MIVGDEPDIYFIPYPVETGRHVPIELLHEAAAIEARRNKCQMKTFEYHGIIEGAPLPGKTERHRAHLWSALQGERK